MREYLRERTGFVLVLTSIVLILCLIITGATQVAFRHDTRSAQEEVVGAQVAACEADHAFRVQYRVRAIAEQKLLALFLDLAKQNIAAVRDVQRSKDFIAEFEPLTKRIHILPVPDCEALRQRLSG